MNIHHRPLYDIEKIAQHYSEKDGVPVKYVCTTDLKNSDVPADVFYRDTPHPHFGNRYFGLFHHPITKHLMITDADLVEDFVFGMVKDDNDQLHYSQSHHDYCAFNNGNMIDGGRQYIRCSGYCYEYRIVNGEFAPVNVETFVRT